MATQMAESPLAVEVAGAQASMEAMAADCPMLVETKHDSDTATPLSKSRLGCQACLLCMSLVSQADWTLNVAARANAVPLRATRVTFVSADPVRQIKPPILQS